MAVAEPADVADRLGRDLTAEETALVATRLDDIESSIRARVSGLDAKITDGTIPLGIVVMVECDAVIRHLRNPMGLTQETDGNYSVTRGGTSGRVELTPDEWALLGAGRRVSAIVPVIPVPTYVPQIPSPRPATGIPEHAPHTGVWA